MSLTWDWDWTPPIVASRIDAARVAEVIDFNVCRMFCKIPFRAWVKTWLGREEAFVTNLLTGVCNVRNQLYRYFEELHQQKHMYELVEEELRCRHPLARWIVSSGLRCPEYPGGPLNPCEALGFLFHPIAALFRGQRLVQTVKNFEVLAVRFEDRVLFAQRVNWESPFATDFSFLKAIRRVDPETLAASITGIDRERFSLLCHKDFLSPDRTRLRVMGEEWNTLADEVKACVIADSDLIQPLSKLAVHLFGLWNYYSATAVLTGLNNAKEWPSKLLILPSLVNMESRLSIFWNVINTGNNYQCYRELWSRNPGLPFLFPHCSELKRASNPGRTLGEIFAFVLNLEWKNESRRLIVDDLYDYIEGQKSPRFTSCDSSSAKSSSAVVTSNSYPCGMSEISLSTDFSAPPTIYHANPHTYGKQQEELHTTSEGVPVPTEGEFTHEDDLFRAQRNQKFSKEVLYKLQAWADKHPGKHPSKDERVELGSQTG